MLLFFKYVTLFFLDQSTQTVKKKRLFNRTTQNDVQIFEETPSSAEQTYTYYIDIDNEQEEKVNK